MKTRFTPILLFVLFALLMAACAPASGQPMATRTLSVNGSAQLMLDPDIAYISIGVQTKGKDAAEATNANNAQAARVVQAMKDMGIADKDLRTINFNIYSQQQYGPNGEMLDLEYVVDNTVYVTLREMEKVSAILDAAVKAGANSVYGIQFDVEDKDAALTKAREMAVESARKQAEQMAAAVGVKLGNVQNVSFYDNGGPTPIYFDNKAAGMGGAERAYAAPINPGQISLNVQVSIIYEIK